MKLVEHSRPRRRLFYFVLLSMLAAALSPAVSGATDPATVLVSDVIYRADGTPASGTV